VIGWPIEAAIAAIVVASVVKTPIPAAPVVIAVEAAPVEASIKSTGAVIAVEIPVHARVPPGRDKNLPLRYGGGRIPSSRSRRTARSRNLKQRKRKKRYRLSFARSCHGRWKTRFIGHRSAIHYPVR